jgi:hypothetical protein
LVCPRVPVPYETSETGTPRNTTYKNRTKATKARKNGTLVHAKILMNRPRFHQFHIKEIEDPLFCFFVFQYGIGGYWNRNRNIQKPRPYGFLTGSTRINFKMEPVEPKKRKARKDANFYDEPVPFGSKEMEPEHFTR